MARWDSKRDKEPDSKDDSQLVQFLREKYEKRRWYNDVPVKPQTDAPAQKEPSQISISKPPEVAKSPQRVSINITTRDCVRITDTLFSISTI